VKYNVFSILGQTGCAKKCMLTTTGCDPDANGVSGGEQVANGFRG